MQHRSARLAWPLFSVLAAMVVASCSEDGTGPRIATLTVFSGNNQSGPIGGNLGAPLVIRVSDQDGKPIEDVDITWTATSGSGQLSPRTTRTNSDGLAQTSLRLGGTVGVQTVSAAYGSENSVSFTATATAAPASRIALESGDAQVGPVGAALPQDITVKVADAFGNPKVGVPVGFTVTSGGGSVNSGSVLSDANGMAGVHWTLGSQAGAQSLSIGAGSLTTVTAIATATPGDPVQVVVLSGDNQLTAPGTPVADSLVVRVVDQFGNGVSGVSVAWTGGTGGGIVSPASVSTNAAGRAATKWTLGLTGGPNTAKATAGTLSASFTGAGFIAFQAVNAGGQSACGVDGGGVLYCWGSNNDGQLGIGADPAGSGPLYTMPQSVAPIGNQTFGQVNGGRYHACGVTRSHVGYCWGDNNNGQLGIGTTQRSANQPTLIAVGIPFQTISAGRAHSCGLTIGGRPYCWGDNDRGQLGGNVTIDTVANTVTLVSANRPAEVGSQIDGKFFATFDFKAIAAGGVHTCAVDFSQRVFCWGLGREGQLGHGANPISQFRPVLAQQAATFDSITAGFNHSCALASDGAAWCWGNNTEGQLGIGNNDNKNTPTAVQGGLSFIAITAGFDHTCALTPDGSVYCWGANGFGQLGTGTTAGSNQPVLVLGGLQFANISAGDQGTCGVTVSGTAYCWGDNQFGAVGDASRTNRPAPSKVAYQP